MLCVFFTFLLWSIVSSWHNIVASVYVSKPFVCDQKLVLSTSNWICTLIVCEEGDSNYNGVDVITTPATIPPLEATISQLPKGEGVAMVFQVLDVLW